MNSILISWDKGFDDDVDESELIHLCGEAELIMRKMCLGKLDAFHLWKALCLLVE